MNIFKNFIEIEKCAHGNAEVYFLHVAAHFSSYILRNTQEPYRKITGLLLQRDDGNENAIKNAI